MWPSAWVKISPKVLFGNFTSPSLQFPSPARELLLLFRCLCQNFHFTSLLSLTLSVSASAFFLDLQSNNNNTSSYILTRYLSLCLLSGTLSQRETCYFLLSPRWGILHHRSGIPLQRVSALADSSTATLAGVTAILFCFSRSDRDSCFSVNLLIDWLTLLSTYSQKFYKLKKESEALLGCGTVNGDAATPVKKTPAKGGRKRKIDADTPDGETPIKRPRGKKAAPAPEVETPVKEEEDTEDVEAPPATQAVVDATEE